MGLSKALALLTFLGWQIDMMSATCDPCDLRAENWETAQQLYRKYRYDHSSSLIYFRFDFGQSSLTEFREARSKNDSFDPSLWAWVAPRGRFLLELPLDYDVASLGLLTLSVSEVKVDMTGSDTCLKALTKGCLEQAVARLIISNLTYDSTSDLSAYAGDGSICRSAYIHPAFESTPPVVVGMKCCSKSSAEEHSRGDYFCDHVYYNSRYKLKEVQMALAIIFSVLFYFAYFGWKRFSLLLFARKNRTWDWLRTYFGFSPSHYVTFILQGRPGSRDHWIALTEEDLLPRGGGITFCDLWIVLGGSKRIAKFFPAIRLIIWGATLMLLINLAIPYYYGPKASTMELLRNGYEIAFNLRSVPIAWTQIKPYLWPKGVGLALVIAVYAQLLIDLICAFTLAFCPNPEKRPKKLTQTRSSNYSCCLTVMAVFIAMLHTVISVLFVAAVVYPAIHIFVYSLTSVLLTADVILPYFIAAFLLMYYVCHTYCKIKEPYIQMKHLLYDEYLHFEEATVAFEYETYGIDPSPGGDSGTEQTNRVKNVEPSRQRLSRKNAAHLLVLFHKDNCARVLRHQFQDICDQLVDRRRHLLRVIMRLFITVVFIGLVLFTIVTFRPPGEYFERTIEGAVAGFVALVACLIPLFIARTHNTEGEFMRRTWRRYEIRRFLESLVLDFDLASKASSFTMTDPRQINQLHRHRYRAHGRSVSNPGSEDERFGTATSSRHAYPTVMGMNGWLPKSPSEEDSNWPGTTRINVTSGDSLLSPPSGNATPQTK